MPMDASSSCMSLARVRKKGLTKYLTQFSVDTNRNLWRILREKKGEVVAGFTLKITFDVVCFVSHDR